MTIAIERPVLTTAPETAPPKTDARFRASYLGLAGTATAPLRRITDARLVTAVGTVTSSWFAGRTIWLRLQSDDGATGMAAIDMSHALAIPSGRYDVGLRIKVRGVARTHRDLPTAYVAVRELTPVI
jgi:hypothetical protein